MEYLLLIFFVFGIQYATITLSKASLQQKLAEDGLEMSDAKWDIWGSKRNRVRLNFNSRSMNTNERVSGHAFAGFFGFRLVLTYDRQFNRLTELRGQALTADPAAVDLIDVGELDLEQRIVFETNQRLERLQGDREAFMRSDTDGDGVVDAAEWDAARSRIAAQVRAELTSQTPSEPVVEQVEEAVSEPDELDVGDGVW